MASKMQGTNSSSFGVPLLLPAPRFGAFECDTPWNLANAVMHAIGPLTGTASGKNNGGAGDLFIRLALHCVAYVGNMFQGNHKAFTIFTGDATSHDNDNQLSRAYVEYVQSAVYSLFKAYLAGPVYAVLVCLLSVFLTCSYISQSMYCIRVTMIHGPKLSMRLTASNPRLFQTSLNGTMPIWQSK